MDDKQKLIDFINTLPDDIQIFQTEQNNFDCIDIKIFTKPKDNEFLDWYFGM